MKLLIDKASLAFSVLLVTCLLVGGVAVNPGFLLFPFSLIGECSWL
jgi:hypothetical protein